MRHFLVFVIRERAAQVGLARDPARQITSAEGRERLPPPRLGVTVTRKVGGAVVRNRIKRLVRESFRRERHRFPSGMAMVWVAKRDATEVSFAQVRSDMQTLARRLSRDPQRPFLGRDESP
jgi:ribonuclease P protein component